MRAPPLEVRMLFAFEHHVEVAVGATVRPGLALPGDPQARAGVHAGWNPQLNRLLALHAALPAAVRAAFFHDLACALAGRARARNRKESLLISHLAAPAARCAGDHARALFRARTDRKSTR